MSRKLIWETIFSSVLVVLIFSGCAGSIKKPVFEIHKEKEAAVFHIHSELSESYKEGYNVPGMEEEYLKWINGVYKNISPDETIKILEENGLKETADKVIRDFLDKGKAEKQDIEVLGKMLRVKYLVISEAFKYRTNSLIGYEERKGLGVASINTSTGEIEWQVFDSIGKHIHNRVLLGKISHDKDILHLLKKSSALKGRGKKAIEDINKDNKKSYFSTLEMLTVKKENYLFINLLAAPAPLSTYESRMMLTVNPSMLGVAIGGFSDEYNWLLPNKFGGGIEINYLQYLDFAYYLNADGQAFTFDASIPMTLDKKNSQNLIYTIGVAQSDPKEEFRLATNRVVYNRIYWINPVTDLTLGYGYVFQGDVNNPDYPDLELSDQTCYGISLIYPSQMYRSTYSIYVSGYGINFGKNIINGHDMPISGQHKLYIGPSVRLGNVLITYLKQIKGGYDNLLSVSFKIIN